MSSMWSFTVCLVLLPSLVRAYGTRATILDAIEPRLRYYRDVSSADPQRLDANLMLGVSIMAGQLMSCTDRSQTNNDFKRMNALTTMVNDLFAKFYEHNLTDIKTIERILDHKLWTSSRKIVLRSSPTGRSPVDGRFLDRGGDSYFRGVSDECIGRAISGCRVTAECVGPEFADGFSGYVLTHQVLYVHVLKKMHCFNDPIVKKMLEEIIRDKCSEVFNEALYIFSDSNTLEKHKDLFIEQIAVCGMENMIEFIRPDWFSIVSSKNLFDCVQYEDNRTACDSHLTGVSLAALGVHWKFHCYKANTIYKKN